MSVAGVEIGPERHEAAHAPLGAVFAEARRRASVDVVGLGVGDCPLGGYLYIGDEHLTHPAVLAGRLVAELDTMLRS